MAVVKKSTRKQTPADVNLAVVLAAIKEIRETNQSAHEDLREIIHDGLKGVQINIDANASVTNDKLQSIDNRFKTLNGTVATIQKESDARKTVVAEFREHQKFGKWVHKNWWVVTLLVIGGITVIVLLLDTLGIRGIWQELKDFR
jgi:ketosteroid isomerase-like protein